MPIYEFECRSCGNRFETLCSMGESGRRLACPECGAKRPEKVLSTFAAHGGDSAPGSSAPSPGTPSPFR